MRCNCGHQMLSRQTGALSWAWVAFDTRECVCKETTTTTSHVINYLLTQRLPLCRVAMFRSVTGELLPHYVTLSGWMRSHCITETRGKAGTAAPREEPLKWDVLSNESNTQWLPTLRQPFWGHVTAGALGGVFFFFFFKQYGWARSWSERRVSFANAHGCVVLLWQCVPLEKWQHVRHCTPDKQDL